MKLIMAIAFGAAALFGGSAASAAEHTARANAPTETTQSSTDISSQRRHYRHYRHHHHYGHRHYRPYYRSYGYAPRRYYGGGPYYGGYGYGGPSITFGFGGGGYRGW
jgi:hypothetical protein